ncbi:hypothetical protein LQF76_14025 [Gloeomargaritales cyanobacterium VI4D9]|nr:hypothetical protein LQF76_14025 [Gloeomargaritales cyanobacterium VI4D9]
MERTRARIVNGVVGIIGSFTVFSMTGLIVLCYESNQSHIFSFNSPAYADSSNLRTVDREVLDLIRRRKADRDKVKDALPGRTYKVNLYRDQGFNRWNRLKIDLDKDNRWDEKWTIKDNFVIIRQVSSRDDEVYDQRFTLAGDQWQRQ